ncbi:MAG: MCE family protein [Gammaproteobacteria bacterium]|nr:MCE family protein [Gammaproteobacteria bacterium]
MKRDNVNYLVVGAFVLVMGMALMVMLYLITGRSGPADGYFVYYSNVAGIKYGTGVFYEGYQVGQVESVSPDRGGDRLRYRVDFSVERNWPIPDDSVAKIVASGLLSAVSIEIEGGDSSRLVEPESEIRGQDQVNLFAAINDFASYFQGMSESDLRPLLRNLNSRISELATEYTDLSASTIRPFIHSLHGRIDDPELIGALKSTLARLDDSAGRLQRLLGDQNQRHVADILGNVDRASKGLEELIARTDEARATMHHVLSELDKVVEENKGPLSGAVANTQAASADLRESLRSVAEHVETVMYHLDGSARNLHEFTRQIRENPGLLLGSSPPTERGEK